MIKKHQKYFLLFSVLISTLIVVVKEWETLLHLNTSFFGDYHDALKNYYTLLYHIQWDEGYRVFEGMNFPYGEHVLFTDNQPLLSSALKFVNKNLFPVAGYSVGIINGLMFLSLVMCTLFSHLCLQQLKVNKWLAIVVAVGLTFFAPQLSRINSHYALSYGFIIPLMIYQSLLFIEKPHLLRSVFIALIVIAVSFLHAYYFGFGLVIFSGLFLVYLFGKKISTKDKILHFAVQVLAPLVVVEMIMILSDPVSDRPSYPWSPYIHDYGVFNIFSGVFFPLGKPMGGWMVQNLNIPLVDWEGITYIGAFASLFFLISILSLPFFLLAKRFYSNPLIQADMKMNFLLAAGMLALAIPVTYSVLSSHTQLYQVIGPLRQFRAATRFNWIFFFIANFYAFAWLSKKLQGHKSMVQWSMVLPAIAILVFDAYSRTKTPFHTTHKLDLMREGTPAQKKMERQLTGYDVMIPVPYFHIGSEDFLVMSEDASHYKNSMAVSYAAGVPMTAVMLSRTSLDQTLESLSYHLMPVEEPPFAGYLEGKKTILLIAKDQQYSPNEQLMINSCGVTVVEGDSYYLREFDLSTYLRLLQEKQQDLNYLSPDLAGVTLYRNYEEDTTNSYSGTGSLAISPQLPREIDTFKIENTGKKDTRIGFWVYLYQQTKALEDVIVKVKDPQGQIVSRERNRIRDSLKAIDGRWGFVEFGLKLPAKDMVLKLELSENTLHPTTTYIDGLRVYENSGHTRQIGKSQQ